MTILRKVFWPAAIALGLLVFMGAIGGTGIVKTASADDGDYCKVMGPSTILVGGHYLYVGVLDKSHFGESEHRNTVSIDNIIGSSKITSALKDDDKYDSSVGPSNLVHGLPDFPSFSLSSDVKDDLKAAFAPDGTPGTGFDVFASQNICGTSSANALTRIYQDAILAGSLCAIVTSGATAGGASAAVNSCLIFGTTGTFTGSSGTTSTVFSGSDPLYDDFDIDCPTGTTCTISSAAIAAVVAAVQADLLAGEDCGTIGIDAGKAAAGAGTSELVALQFYDFTLSLCHRDFDASQLDEDSFLDSFVIVDVTCFSAGTFDITFTDQGDEADSATMAGIKCLGAPSSKSTVTATPNSIEIVPAVGNVSNSFINVTLLDSDGNQAGPADVDFITDRCSVESSSVDTVAEWNAIAPIFGNINVAVPSTAAAVQASLAGTTQPDSTRGQDSMVAVGLATSTRAGTILMCDPLAAPGAAPGVATVTVIIDSTPAGIAVGGSVNDIVLTVKVTVVGPPASIVVAASPTSVRCGEKSTITATVKDAIGQNVSEHTRVEAVTNAGGTLAGTGAVANQAGLVSPISSTVSETFSGVSTFFLLTSEQHSGPYEVVVTSGGQGALGSALGGVFSTPPVSAQATVTCSLPAAPVAPVAVAPAPTVTAPRTGTAGITPPNTGDAGLASSNSSSSTLFAAAGVVAFALAGVVVFKKKGISE